MRTFSKTSFIRTVTFTSLVATVFLWGCSSAPPASDMGSCENLSPVLTEKMFYQIPKDGKVTLEWNSDYVMNCDLSEGSWTYTIENANLEGGKKTYPVSDMIKSGNGDGIGTPFFSSTTVMLPEGNSRIYATVMPKGVKAGVNSQMFALVFGKADNLFKEMDANREMWLSDLGSDKWGGALSNPQFSPENVSANFKKHISKAQYETMFPVRWGSDAWDAFNTDVVPHLADEPDFYAYENFIGALEDMARLKLLINRREGTNLQEVIRLDKASGKQMLIRVDADYYALSNVNKPIVSQYIDFGAFANDGTDVQQRREIAAFFANIGHETTGGGGGWGGGWNVENGPHTWGLFYREEIAWSHWKPGDEPAPYVEKGDPNFPGTPGQSYHGRGPIQLSWNFNYGYMSALVFGNISTLLDDPSMIIKSGVLAFDTSLWFWMTPQAPKPSAHSIIAGTWDYTTEPVAVANNIQDGFGATINVINGGLEAGPRYTREIKIDNGVLTDSKSGKALTAFYIAVLDSRGIEDRTSSMSIGINLEANSIKEIKVDNDKLLLKVDIGDGVIQGKMISTAGEYKVSGSGSEGKSYFLRFRIQPGSPVQVSDYTDIIFNGTFDELNALSNAQLGTSDKFSEFVTLQSSGTQYIVIEDARVHDRLNFYDYFVRTLTGSGDLLGHQIGVKNQKSFF